jgi:acyl carrier protein
MSHDKDRRAKIRDYIVREFNPEIEIGYDTPLVEEGIVDSLAVFSIIGFIAEEYGLQVDPENIDYKNFETINTIDALIASMARG